MSPEVASCSARVFTLIALERFFSRMFPLVPVEIRSFCARVLALAATVGLSCNLKGFFSNFFHLTSNSNANIDGVTFKVEGKLNSRELKCEIEIEK